ncbi:MAG: glycosyltransferase [Deltaproteobacteria bacterium]|nr:glycosyltransferase [Deltaproteobacteria bacterium]
MEKLSGTLAEANDLLKQGAYKEALASYKRYAATATGVLQASAMFNIRLIEKKIQLNEQDYFSLDDKSAVARIAQQAESYSESDSQCVEGQIDVFGTNPTHIQGWAIDRNGDKQVEIAVYIDDIFVAEATANSFRSNLKTNRIGNGYHGYFCEIPLVYLNGKKHTVKVKEKITGILCGERQFASEQAVNFTDFNEMQNYNILDPVFSAPFDEYKKRCLAYMDVVAKSFSALGKKNESTHKVTILMAVFNRQDCVKEAIDSVLAQTYQNIELLIGDDGSCDGTPQLLNSVKHEKVKVFLFPKNRGKAAVLNDLFNNSDGNLVAYLDSDNTWDPKYIAAMVGAYVKSGASVLYSGQYLFSGNATKPYAVRYAPFNRNLLYNRNYIDHNSFFHERIVFEVVGGYDSALRRCLDYDFIIKAVSMYRTVSVPVCLTNYHYEKSGNAITGAHHLISDMHKVRADAQKLMLTTKRSSSPYLTQIISKPCKKMSVIIPNYESLEDLKDCIKALDSMAERKEIELIIIDNNSSFETKAFLREQQQKKTAEIVLNEYNYGFTYAVNQGIELAAKNTDVILLNNDALPASGAFRLMSQFCSFKDDVGAVVPAQVLEPKTPTIKTHVPYAREDAYCDVNLSVHHRNMAPIPMLSDGTYYKVTFAPFFCVYLPRQTINEIGYLDAELGRHYRSDRLYSNQIVKYLEKSIYYLPDSVVIHKLQKSTAQLKTGSDKGFDEMFKKNIWPDHMLNILGYEKKCWF